MKPIVRVCLTTALIPTFKVEEYIVVVVDILRATTTITVALDRGASVVRVVSSLAACRALKKEGYLIAAERGAQKVPGFDLGNSPQDFLRADLKGKKIALTTTNGTRALQKVKKARQVVAGAFTNISLLTSWLQKQETSVLILCAGWKDHINLEDTIFAGALASRLEGVFDIKDDATLLALSLYHQADSRKKYYLQHSAHFERLTQLGIQEDVKYCLRSDLHPVIPYLEGDCLVPLRAWDVERVS